jgi:hypothetical protein
MILQNWVNSLSKGVLFQKILKRQKQRVGQVIHGKPAPLFCLMGFPVVKGSQIPDLNLYTEGDIMLILIQVQVIGHGEQLGILSRQTRFFKQFSQGASLKGFSPFQVTPRRGPGGKTVAGKALA